MSHKNKKLPIVYSCSGCSSAAQMSNWLAVKLDREKAAEMSCIVGVGGHVPSLVRKAKNAETIIGIDGCKLSCVKATLKQHDLKCDQHFELSELGVKKEIHKDFDQEQAEKVLNHIKKELKNPSQQP